MGIAPYIIVIELSNSWSQIGMCIWQVREPWLPNRTRIIIMCPAPPSEAFLTHFNLINDDNIGIVIGSPKWVPDLLQAGVQEASFIPCPSLDVLICDGDGPNPEELEM